MCGVRSGYVDRSACRRDRWTDDLSFCFGEDWILERERLAFGEGLWIEEDVLFLEHGDGLRQCRVVVYKYKRIEMD